MGVKILGLVKNQPSTHKPVINMRVTFGPGFANGTLTRKEFIEKLREQAKKRKNHFLGDMFEHYADHLEAAAKSLGGDHSLDKPANLSFDNTYYGEGSCDGCSLSHPGGSCCRCDHDGISSCEPCG